MFEHLRLVKVPLGIRDHSHRIIQLQTWVTIRGIIPLGPVSGVLVEDAETVHKETCLLLIQLESVLWTLSEALRQGTPGSTFGWNVHETLLDWKKCQEG